MLFLHLIFIIRLGFTERVGKQTLAFAVCLKYT
jgi:hypothetical protein